jgi:hypothetical protein
MPTVQQTFLIVTALLLAFLIWRVGTAMLRSVSGSGFDRTKPEVEDVEELDVFLVCHECGTELHVTRLGELQVPRHCGEPMQVVRRPAVG